MAESTVRGHLKSCFLTLGSFGRNIGVVAAAITAHGHRAIGFVSLAQPLRIQRSTKSQRLRIQQFENGLMVNFDRQGVNVLRQPQVQQGITNALNQTSAPALAGGAGVPL